MAGLGNVDFLNDMVECNILETTGASWRFRHCTLQDYFADQWVETEFEPEQKRASTSSLVTLLLCSVLHQSPSIH